MRAAGGRNGRIDRAGLLGLGAPAPPRLRRLLGGGDELGQKPRQRPRSGRVDRGCRARPDQNQGAAKLCRLSRFAARAKRGRAARVASDGVMLAIARI
jgi:hypothetical protein